jgi:membrane protease YdiL (CAAX protease family)
LVAARLVALRGYGGPPLAAAIAALVLLLLPYFLLGTTALSQQLGTWIESRPPRALVLIGLPLLPYVVYASGTGSFSWLALLTLFGFVSLPLVLLLSARRSGAPPRWQDALAVLAVWLPVELGGLQAVWPWPAGAGAYTLCAILGVDVALVLFVSVRRLEGVGYSFAIRRIDLRAAFWNFLVFFCVAVPIGLATRFIVIADHPSDLLRFASRFLGIFLVIAVPEELLFRGLIQNLLQRVFPETYALLVAALIFGASHLNNGPVPDWRYVLLASIAGVFYGRAYRSSGGLMAACLVHAAVDTVWREFFR